MFDEELLRELAARNGSASSVRWSPWRARIPPRTGVVRRGQAVGLAAIIICCVILAAWIGVLAVTLPRYYRSGG